MAFAFRLRARAVRGTTKAGAHGTRAERKSSWSVSVPTDGTNVVCERAATSEIGRFATTLGRVIFYASGSYMGTGQPPLQGHWAINSITVKTKCGQF